MTETRVSQQKAGAPEHAEWRTISKAILRTSELTSLDELLDEAINLWLTQLAPTVRWQVALDMYTAEEVSLGRAAEIAGLPTVIFMEKLHEEGVPFVAAQSTEAQKKRRKALIHVGLTPPAR